MDGKAERRWLGTSPCDNERTIALRTNVLRAYEGKPSELIPPGPRSRVGTMQLIWVSSAYCPNVTYLLFGGRKALCCCCWCGTPAEKQWAILQQREEGERRALAESILQAGEAREVEAEPVAG